MDACQESGAEAAVTKSFDLDNTVTDQRKWPDGREKEE